MFLTAPPPCVAGAFEAVSARRRPQPFLPSANRDTMSRLLSRFQLSGKLTVQVPPFWRDNPDTQAGSGRQVRPWIRSISPVRFVFHPFESLGQVPRGDEHHLLASFPHFKEPLRFKV